MRVNIERMIAGACLLAVAGCGGGGEGVLSTADSAAVAETVRERSAALQQAELAREVATAASFFDEDAIVQAPGAPQVEGRANIIAAYQAFFGNKALKEMRGTPSRESISETGDMAWEYGVKRNVFTSARGDVVDRGKYLIVWKHEDDNWFVLALSFSNDSSAAAPVIPGAPGT